MRTHRKALPAQSLKMGLLTEPTSESGSGGKKLASCRSLLPKGEHRQKGLMGNQNMSRVLEREGDGSLMQGK